MDDVIFIVGPHGVGKTYAVNALRNIHNGIIHIDLGPLIRQIHKKFSPDISMEEWIKKGEKKYGKNFTDILLCKGIEKIVSTCNSCNEKKFLITGSRSKGGIDFIVNKFKLNEPKIIYLTAPFYQLKSNYENREKISLSNEEFNQILDAEKKMGLDDLEIYAQNNSFIEENDNSDNFIQHLEFIVFNQKTIDREMDLIK